MNKQPNIILVLTDDQGYGDLACHGSPWMISPDIDNFHKESVRFTNYHVSPLCTPTRGALYTGRRPLSNGAWDASGAHSLLYRNQVTIAEVLGDNGYNTGLFGKWHLGANYPYRPHDRGFQRVVAHRGGGIGQTPDFWGNNYFDDTYFANGKPTQYEGYCTDIWFERAIEYIRESKDTPFFAVIATNAPHVPHVVEKRYEDLYLNKSFTADIPHPKFCGMVTNIDENFGKLRKELKDLKIKDNTILIFMTDNGSAGGIQIDRNTKHLIKGYNSDMRGRKGDYYEGGHRVPFFIYWPEGKITGGRDIDELTCHIDFFRTLLDLCEIDYAPTANVHTLHGRSLAPLLRGEIDRWNDDRTEIIQINANKGTPDKELYAVLTKKWRLVYGRELYDISKDPGQRNDVAAESPEVVERLKKVHDDWWADVSTGLGIYPKIPLGNEQENPCKLVAFDCQGDCVVHQIDVVLAFKSSGRWSVTFEKKGRYRFSLNRWPVELGIGIADVVDDDAVQQLAPYKKNIESCTPLDFTKGKIKIFDREYQEDIIDPSSALSLEVDVEQEGNTILEAWFLDRQNQVHGAYYVYVELL
jgi:arylsulfatase A-like enzyme